MTNNWFSSFYRVVQNPPTNLIEKAAFAEFGKQWYFQNKVAERIKNGRKLYEHLCNNKEARELYDSLVNGVTGVALLKKEASGLSKMPKKVCRL